MKNPFPYLRNFLTQTTIVLIQILCISCGQNENKIQLSAIMRKTNVLFNSIELCKEREQYINQISVPRFYLDIISETNSLRSELAGLNLNRTYENIRILHDQMLTSTINIYIKKQEILYEISEAFENANDYKKNTYDYNDNEKAVNSILKYYKNQNNLDTMGAILIGNITSLGVLIDSINNQLDKYKITDHLNKRFLNTQDFIIESCINIQSFEPMYDYDFLFN